MNRISLLLLIVFSLFSTACVVSPRPTVVLGRPGVIYRAPTNDRNGNSVTVAIQNKTDALIDVSVFETVVVQNLAPGDVRSVVFQCRQGGFITFSVGDNTRRGRGGSNTQYEMSAVAHRDSVNLGFVLGAPRVNLNCPANQAQPTHRSIRWEVQRIQPLTKHKAADDTASL